MIVPQHRKTPTCCRIQWLSYTWAQPPKSRPLAGWRTSAIPIIGQKKVFDSLRRWTVDWKRTSWPLLAFRLAFSWHSGSYYLLENYVEICDCLWRNPSRNFVADTPPPLRPLWHSPGNALSMRQKLAAGNQENSLRHRDWRNKLRLLHRDPAKNLGTNHGDPQNKLRKLLETLYGLS